MYDSRGGHADPISTVDVVRYEGCPDGFPTMAVNFSHVVVQEGEGVNVPSEFTLHYRSLETNSSGILVFVKAEAVEVMVVDNFPEKILFSGVLRVR